jgi:hypothetical protein
MTKIGNVTELLTLWPDEVVPKRARDEVHVPCPFCPVVDQSDTYYKNGVSFVGDDRFKIFSDGHAWCNVCGREGRGHNGVYLLPEIAQRLVFDVAAQFDITPLERIVVPLSTIGEFDLTLAHALVHRDYWYKFGWDDVTIDYFRLGYYEMYHVDGPVHVIPMEVRTDEDGSEVKWFLEGRNPDPQEGQAKTKRLRGSSRNYFWHINTDPSDRMVVLVEGAKDAVSAYHLGYKNIVANLGTGTWTMRKTAFLKRFGYQKFIIFGDNDPAGQDFSLKGYIWADRLGLDTQVIKWTDDKRENYDLTNLLEENGVEQTRLYIQDNLYKPNISQEVTASKPVFIQDFREVDPFYEPEKLNLITLDDIRGDGDLSMRSAIRRYITSYSSRKRRGHGILLLLNAPPGSGKTHVMVETAEQAALESMRRKAEEWQKLTEDYNDALKAIDLADDPEEKDVNRKVSENIKRRIEAFSQAAVLWSTQYKSGFDNSVDVPIDHELWFEFEARNINNCANYEVATTLGQFNHNVGAYCAVACPMRDACKKRGYLAQDTERRSKPITVVRHQHLRDSNMLSDYTDLVLIDESPLGIIDTPMYFEPGDFRPHISGWEMEVADGEMVHAINLFEKALRSAIQSNSGEPQQFENKLPNERYMISGSKFLALIDSNLKASSSGAFDLTRVATKIDPKILHDIYQPSFLNGNINAIQRRCMPFVFDAILKEFEHYKVDPDNEFPSALHLVAGVLEVYENDSLKINASTPVMVADATADMPELYAGAFNRELDIYAPKVRNDNAHIVVVTGSDWTRGELERKMGRQIRDRANRKAEFVQNMAGEKFYLHDIPTNPNLYDNNSLLKDYADAIYSLVEHHSSVLVVIHKKVRDILEDVFRYKYPAANAKISWGHYGALRGTNQYKSCDAVVLLGVSRIPYDVVWRKVQAWASLLQIDTPIKYQFVYKPRPYHGQYTGHSFRTFEHPFAQRYVDMVEEGEMIQSMERIRPHATTDEKHIYIFASRPVGQHVTTVTTKTQVLNLFRSDSSLNRVKDYMSSYYTECGKFPTKREVMTALKCGYETYKEARSLTENELGIRIVRQRRR